MAILYEPEMYKVADRDIWFRCLAVSGHWEVHICSDATGTPMKDRQDGTIYRSHSEACEAAERMAGNYGT